jgi:hypothetical protein
MHATTPYKLVRATGATAPADCTGTAIYSGTATSYNNTGRSAGTQYSYRVCAYDAANNVTLGLTASATTLANQPPAFSPASLTKSNATATIAYTGQTLSGAATDPEGDTITYSKVSGPAWLSVATNGTLSGTPSAAGTDVFTVRATATGGTGDATLTITVLAAPTSVTYYVTPGTATAVGVDGNTNYTADQPSAGVPIRTMMGNATANTSYSYRPSPPTQGAWTTLMRAYSPVYASTKSILAATAAAFSVRGYNINDQWRFNIYSYNPAGSAGNKTLVLTSSEETPGSGSGGSTVTLNPTYSGSGTIPAGHRLLLQVDYYRGGSSSSGPRIYNTNSTFTVSEQ